MMEVLPSPDHVVAISISGTLTADNYDKVIETVEAKLKKHDHIGVMVDLMGFDDITLKAGMKDARYAFSKMWELRRFPREAVITDKQWIKTMVQFTSPLLPFVEVKVFEPGEREEAIAWAAEIREPVWSA